MIQSTSLAPNTAPPAAEPLGSLLAQKHGIIERPKVSSPPARPAPLPPAAAQSAPPERRSAFSAGQSSKHPFAKPRTPQRPRGLLWCAKGTDAEGSAAPQATSSPSSVTLVPYRFKYDSFFSLPNCPSPASLIAVRSRRRRCRFAIAATVARPASVMCVPARSRSTIFGARGSSCANSASPKERLTAALTMIQGWFAVAGVATIRSSPTAPRTSPPRRPWRSAAPRWHQPARATSAAG